MPRPIIRADTKTRRVCISAKGVARFNARWPCSPIPSSRGVRFDFDASRNLVDHNLSRRASDDSAALVLSQDAEAFLFDGVTPEWS